MEFIEAPAFTRYLADYFDEDSYRELQQRLAAGPESGDLMPGTGGFRKLRWRATKKGKGTRGGLRIIYYYFASDQQIWLMTLYGKDEAADLTSREKQALRRAVEMESLQRAEKRRKRGSKVSRKK
jgi:hypothetical protein